MKTKFIIGLAVLFMGVFASFLFGGVGVDKNADISALLQNGALVIDVRTPGEFSGGHVEGAVNIPYDEIAGKIGAIEKDKNRAIIVYCRSGARSAAAMQSLESAGYTHVVNGGGLRAMRKAIAD